MFQQNRSFRVLLESVLCHIICDMYDIIIYYRLFCYF